jgi:hypothetical protein
MIDKQESLRSKLASHSLEEQRQALSEIIACNTPPDLIEAIAESGKAKIVFEEKFVYVAQVSE